MLRGVPLALGYKKAAAMRLQNVIIPAMFDEIMAELKPFLDDPHYLRLTRLCVHYVVSCNAQRLAAEDIRNIDTTIRDTLGEETMIPMNNTIYTSGRAEGRTEGRTEGRADVARNMQRGGFDSDTIAKMTGLSPSEIANLK